MCSSADQKTNALSFKLEQKIPHIQQIFFIKTFLSQNTNFLPERENNVAWVEKFRGKCNVVVEPRPTTSLGDHLSFVLPVEKTGACERRLCLNCSKNSRIGSFPCIRKNQHLGGILENNNRQLNLKAVLGFIFQHLGMEYWRKTMKKVRLSEGL